MRDNDLTGYFPPGKAPVRSVYKRGGAPDPMGYFPPAQTVTVAEEAPVEPVADAVWSQAAPGICPFCGFDATEKANPAASVLAHVRAKKADGVHYLP